MSLKSSLHQLSENFEKLKREAPAAVGNMAQNFFRSSFEKGGFTDRNYVPWVARKGEFHLGPNVSGRALLVKTGHLRQSVGNSLKASSFEAIEFLVPEPYAKIQNEGGTITIPERDHVLSFGLKGKSGKMKSGFVKASKAGVQQKVSIGTHTITIPARKFMGYSDTLLHRIDEYMKNAINPTHA